MISDDVRKAGLAAISVAAAMLVEDAHEALIAMSGGVDQDAALGTLLGRLGGDLTALADTTAVFARRD